MDTGDKASCRTGVCGLDLSKQGDGGFIIAFAELQMGFSFYSTFSDSDNVSCVKAVSESLPHGNPCLQRQKLI